MIFVVILIALGNELHLAVASAMILIAGTVKVINLSFECQSISVGIVTSWARYSNMERYSRWLPAQSVEFERRYDTNDAGEFGKTSSISSS
jgi:hypothetical protein